MRTGGRLSRKRKKSTTIIECYPNKGIVTNISVTQSMSYIEDLQRVTASSQVMFLVPDFERLKVENG